MHKDGKMKDYNDGKWHGWNGGQCPVHPDAQIVCIYNGCSTNYAGNYPSQGCRGRNAPWADIVAFRVTTPYVEPPKPCEVYAKEVQVVGFDERGYTKIMPSNFYKCEKGERGAALFREVLTDDPS